MNPDTSGAMIGAMTDSTRPPKPDRQPIRPKEEELDNGPNLEGAGGPGRIEVVIRRADRFQQDHGVLGFPFAVIQKFGNDQAGSKAALVAYYGLFALFPLLLLFTTILGYTLHDNRRLQADLVDSALGNFPIIGPQLQSHTHALTGSVSAVVIGSVLLLYGAVGLGLATQSAMNVVWNIPYVRWPSIYLRYLRALGVLVLLALSAIGSTVLTGFATLVSHGWIATGLLVVGSLALNFVLILLAFNLLTADALELARDLLRRCIGGPLLANLAAHRKLVRGSRAAARHEHLWLLRHRDRLAHLDLLGCAALPACGRDKRRPALSALATLYDPAATYGGRQTGL